MDASNQLGPVPKSVKAIIIITVLTILLASWLMSINHATQEAAAPEYIYQRQELHYALLGRPRDEVIEMIGRPRSSTPQSRPGSEYWYYRDPPTWDEAAGRRDDSMIVYFKDFRVSELDF